MRLLSLPPPSPLARDIELKILEKFLFVLSACNISVVTVSHLRWHRWEVLKTEALQECEEYGEMTSTTDASQEMARSVSYYMTKGS